MSEFESLNSEQREFEQALKQLRPVDPGLDVADLMFRAGQDSVRQESRRQLRRWQLSTLVTSVCALLAVSILWPGTTTHPAPQNSLANEQSPSQRTLVENTPDEQTPLEQERVPESVAEIDPSYPPQSPLPEQPSPLFDWWTRLSTVSVSTEGSYIDLRNRVLRDGVEGAAGIKDGRRFELE